METCGGLIDPQLNTEAQQDHCADIQESSSAAGEGSFAASSGNLTPDYDPRAYEDFARDAVEEALLAREALVVEGHVARTTLGTDLPYRIAMREAPGGTAHWLRAQLHQYELSHHADRFISAGLTAELVQILKVSSKHNDEVEQSEASSSPPPSTASSDPTTTSPMNSCRLGSLKPPWAFSPSGKWDPGLREGCATGARGRTTARLGIGETAALPLALGVPRGETGDGGRSRHASRSKGCDSSAQMADTNSARSRIMHRGF